MNRCHRPSRATTGSSAALAGVALAALLSGLAGAGEAASPAPAERSTGAHRVVVGFEGQTVEFQVTPGRPASPSVMPKDQDPTLDAAIPAPRPGATNAPPTTVGTPVAPSELPAAAAPQIQKNGFELPPGWGQDDLASGLDTNGRIVIYDITFDTGSSEIKPGSYAALRRILGLLQSKADLKLLIEGHTDNVGDASYNQTLSEQRATSIRSWLVSQGVDGGRLRAVGKGLTAPIGSNDTEEGRAKNRRVELVKE